MSIDEPEEAAVEEEAGDMGPLTTTENLFAKATSIWHCFEYAFVCDEAIFRYWQRLTDVLVLILEQDWQSIQINKLDVDKTLLMRLLKDGKDVDIKKVVRTILVQRSEDIAKPIAIYDQIATTTTEAQVDDFEEIALAEWGSYETLETRHRLLLLLEQVTTVPRHRAIAFTDFVNAVANEIGNCSVPALILFLETMPLGTLLLGLTNLLLFRWANMKESGAADRHVTWTKVRKWSLATSRSRNIDDAVRVEFVKLMLVRSYKTVHGKDAMAEGELEEVKSAVREQVRNIKLLCVSPKLEAEEDAAEYVKILQRCTRELTFLFL